MTNSPKVLDLLSGRLAEATMWNGLTMLVSQIFNTQIGSKGMKMELSLSSKLSLSNWPVRTTLT